MILESPKVRISKQATKKVIGGALIPFSVFSGPLGAVIVTGIMGHLWVSGGCGPILGTVPLAHKVADTQHGRVVHEVAPTGFGCPLCAPRIGTQGLAKLGVETVEGRVQVRGQGHKVRGALLDPALGRLLAVACGREDKELISDFFRVPACQEEKPFSSGNCLFPAASHIACRSRLVWASIVLSCSHREKYTQLLYKGTIARENKAKGRLQDSARERRN